MKFIPSAKSVEKRRKSWGRSVAATSLVTVTALSLAPTMISPRAEAASPGRNGAIAFTVSKVPEVDSAQGGGFDFDLFTVSSTGQRLTRLSNGPEDDFSPAWSPDGRRIAFLRRDPASTSHDIYVMDLLDPPGATNLTASPLENEESPSWSPDGSKIVFAKADFPLYFPEPRSYHLYVMDSDGGNVVQLTDDTGNQLDPTWSPRGDVIAYVVDSDSIRLLTPGGSARGIVAAGIAPNAPSWSPDGRKITFEAFGDIWVINREGSFRKNLTGTPQGSDERNPSWSPDGKWIAFVSNREGDYKLFRMRPDGSAVTKIVDITLTADSAGNISWGPLPT